MRKIKAFFHIFYKSITSVKYYKDILASNFNLSIKYFVGLIILSAIVNTIISSITVIPEIKSVVTKLAGQVTTLYPDDLIVTVENNEWSINKVEPLVIGFPQGETPPAGFPENLLVLDHKGTIDDVDKYKALALINSKNILLKESQGLRVYPLQDIPNGKLDKTMFVNFINRLQSFVSYLPYFAILILFFTSLLYLSFARSIYLIFLGFVIWAIALIINVKLTLKNCIRIVIHSMTLSVVLEAILMITKMNYRFPMVFVVSNLIFGVIVLAIFMKDPFVIEKKENNP